MKQEITAVQRRIANPVQKPQEESNPLQSLLDSSLDVICSIDVEGRFTYVSTAARQVWGYEPGELVGRKYMQLVVTEDHEMTSAVAATIMSGVDVTSFENRYTKKDGSIVPILWSARWSAPEQLMYCVAKDATQIKIIQEQKKLLNKRLYRAYQLTQIAWWEYDMATQTYTSSEEIFTMYGLPIPAKNQNTLEEFLSNVHPEDRQKLQLDLSSICQETHFNYEHRVVKPTGEVIYVIHYLEVIRDENGNPIAVHGTTKDITRRKLQQIRLEESEKKAQAYAERLSEILESIGDGFFTLDKEWTVTYWNRKAEELLGKKKEAILGRNIWHEYQNAVSLKFYSEYHRALAQRVSVQFEEYFPPLKMWIEVAAYPSLEGLSVFFKDITNRKWQEEALHLANERFELVAKATSDALWDWDVITNTCYFSEGFTALFGHENRADVIYKNWMDNIHQNDQQEILASLTRAMNDATVTQWKGEYRFYRQDRSIAHVLDRGYIIRDGEGKAVRMVGSLQDITRLKETEEEMEKLSLVAKETANMVVITDKEDKITWVNKAFSDLTEYSFEEAIDKRPGALLQGPKTSERTKNYLRKCVKKQQPFHCEILSYTKSGKEYWLEIKGQPLFDERGELKQFFAIQTDITARKEAEAAIKLSEEKYKLLFDNSPQPKWIFDAETFKVVDVNEAACALYGYCKEEFLRLRIRDLKTPEDELELVTAAQTLKTKLKGHFHKLVRHKKKNGDIFFIEIKCCPLQLTTGLHVIVTGIDMTEKLQLQQRLLEEKIAAQKQVARAIIHAQETERSEIGKELHDNVCQLLTTSKLYIENIKYMPEQRDEFTKKGVDLLLRSINEIRYLSRQLVSPVLSDVGFEASVEELINHYRAMNLFQIQFSYGAGIELGDKDLQTSIIRILQEQFNNTVKYAQASLVEVCISQTAEKLVLHYADNGLGFDPAKSKTGIGLMNIKNRASSYRGTMSLTTTPGKGCSMEIVFPLNEQEEPTYFTNPLHN